MLCCRQSSDAHRSFALHSSKYRNNTFYRTKWGWIFNHWKNLRKGSFNSWKTIQIPSEFSALPNHWKEYENWSDFPLTCSSCRFANGNLINFLKVEGPQYFYASLYLIYMFLFCNCYPVVFWEVTVWLCSIEWDPMFVCSFS